MDYHSHSPIAIYDGLPLLVEYVAKSLPVLPVTVADTGAPDHIVLIEPSTADGVTIGKEENAFGYVTANTGDWLRLPDPEDVVSSVSLEAQQICTPDENRM